MLLYQQGLTLRIPDPSDSCSSMLNHERHADTTCQTHRSRRLLRVGVWTSWGIGCGYRRDRGVPGREASQVPAEIPQYECALRSRIEEGRTHDRHRGEGDLSAGESSWGKERSVRVEDQDAEGVSGRESSAGPALDLSRGKLPESEIRPPILRSVRRTLLDGVAGDRRADARLEGEEPGLRSDAQAARCGVRAIDNARE